MVRVWVWRAVVDEVKWPALMFRDTLAHVTKGTLSILIHTSADIHAKFIKPSRNPVYK